MSDELFCYAFVEDAPSAAILKRLLDERNRTSLKALRFFPGFPKPVGGFGTIKKNAKNHLKMGMQDAFLTIVLTDLDAENCAPTLIQKWFSLEADALPKNLVFRVAVREVEFWILADRDEFAKFLGVSRDNLSSRPDELPDPKQHLFTVIRAKSSQKIRDAMLPREHKHQTASIGPQYNQRMCEFIRGKWSPERASQRSPSLRRAINAINSL